MSLIHAHDLSKSFGERTLFSGVAFDVFGQDRVGLVGVNGCGKTTLLNMIAGRVEHDGGGQLFVSKGARVAQLDQSPVWPEDATLFDAALEASGRHMQTERELEEISARLAARDADADALIRRQADLHERYQSEGGLTYRARTRSTLLGLGFSDEDMLRPVAVMSGGEMRKAALAKVLLSDAELLLLDEPTNHLDIAALEWLESYLAAFRGAFLVTSHDRYFLDRVCTRIFEMENGSLRAYAGNYTESTEHKLDEREYAMRRYKNALREIKRIEGIIEQQRRWNQARNYVTIASKQKQIERIRSGLVKPEEPPRAIRFRLEARPLVANEAVVCKGLAKRYGAKTVFSGLDLLIRRDERVCLIGANGCGKTTLLNILANRVEPDEGSYRVGANVELGYYEQTSVRPEDTHTVLDALRASFPRYDSQVFRNLLGSFLFRGDDVYKRVCDLSGGEYARVQLLRLMLSGSNVLLLDEPTNHLDILSREALENALGEYGGTMLIVTHDRYLANRIADRIVLMDEGGVRSFEGDWDGYQAFLAESTSAFGADEDADTGEPNAYRQTKERRSALNRAKGALERAERGVSEAERAHGELERLLAGAGIAPDYETSRRLYEQLEVRRAEVEAAYAAWELAESDYRTLLGEDA